MKLLYILSTMALTLPFFTSCNSTDKKTEAVVAQQSDTLKKEAISQPLVSHIYTADPSAHLFGSKIYIYPSHDTATGTPENDLGDHFNMMDYHVLSMDSVGGKVTDHGIALHIKDIPWAGRQLWAPDAAYANGKYYLYFPVKDKNDVFKIGVAIADKPEGPFKAEKEPMKGTYSIDPCIYPDGNGNFYMYLGGIWGGQLQRWDGNNKYDGNAQNKKSEDLAVLPRMAKLTKDMKNLAEDLKEIKLVDDNGNLFYEKDNAKRFFEAPWVHHYNGKYYFSYSTGDTHNICYATGDNPYGPFTYKGILLNPVDGWTNHHSILEIKGKWYLFYHDVQLSGKTHLRNVKVTELTHNPDGSITTISAYK